MTTSAPSSRQRWLVPVVVVVLSVTVGGGLLARELYHRPDQPADDTSVSVSTPASPSSGLPAATGVVGMTPDAAAHPQADSVRSVLQTYFSAINSRNYVEWTTIVSNDRRHSRTQIQWRADFRSTKDFDARIYRIERGQGASLRVLVAFTSTQDPADAPEDMQVGCLHWRLVMPMIVESNALKIDTVDNGPRAEHEKC